MGHVFVNIEDKAELTEFNSKTLKVMHTWPLAPCKIPTGLSSISLISGSLWAAAAVSWRRWTRKRQSGCNVADRKRRRCHALRSGNPVGVRLLRGWHHHHPHAGPPTNTLRCRRLPRSRERARWRWTGNHNMYTVTSDFGPSPAPTKDEPHPRPKVISSTFRLLIYSQ